MGVRSTSAKAAAAADHAQRKQVSFAAAGRLFGVSRQIVQRVWRERYGATKTTPIARRRSLRVKRLATLARVGTTASSIANELGVTPRAVRALAAKHGIHLRGPYER